jgi:leucyl-tRNA synthetase
LILIFQKFGIDTEEMNMKNTIQDSPKYDFKTIEAKWQRHWQDEKSYKVNESPDREKYYLLEMFPYPSGRSACGKCGPETRCSSG